MIEIVVVSDNHGKIEVLEEVVKKHPNADCYVHCGDAELPEEYLENFVMVAGNNDYFVNLPDIRVIRIEPLKILIIHGHQFMSLRRKGKLVEKAHSLGCNLVLYGHSHVYEHDERGGVTLVNPGSMRYNRDGTPPSYALIHYEEGEMVVTRMNV